MTADAIAYLNWGLWVANCIRPGCLNAEHFGKHPITGHLGGLTGTTFRCGTNGGGCGLTCAAVWPPNVADIERLTMCRPAPMTRNWYPGETVHDLLAENLEHGVIPAVPDGFAGGTLMEIVGDHITADALTAGLSRPVLGAGA